MMKPQTTAKPAVLIIGAGWLGTQLAVTLSQHEYQVAITRRTPAALADCPAHVAAFCWDGCQTPSKALQQFAENAVLVCCIPPNLRAASKVVDQTNNGADQLENRPIGAAYLDSLQLLRPLVAQSLGLIFCSSSGVLHGCEGVVDEATPLPEILSPSAHVLRQAELLWQPLPRVHILRLAGLIGPKRHPARFGKAGTMQGAALPVNLVHVDDVIAFIMVMLNRWPLVASASRLYHLVAPDHPTKAQFYPLACQQFGLPAPRFESCSEPARLVTSCHVPVDFGDFHYQHANLLHALRSCS